jgi:putative methionine-R-sulfoxide reductase with GAF domain
MSEDRKIRDYTKDKLYELVPAIYRQLESKSNKKPLEALLNIISRQVDILENDIAGLYDNWFIETCDEWVTAYLADLVGARSLETRRVSSVSEATGVSQRAYVANTIAYRRRKGTLAVLEQLSKDITSWDSHAVEFFQLLGTAQHVNHLRLANHRTPDLRDTNALELLDTPFDKIAHTVEVRRISSGRAYYNIPNVGIFLWRLQSFLSDDTPAFRIDSNDLELKNKCFTFHPLGYDEPIFNSPETEAGITSISGETHVSAPIRIRALYENIRDYYGRSLSIKVRYVDDLEERKISAGEIRICNLKEWHKPEDGKVAVDPTLGRIRLSKEAAEVRVVYYYGFSGKMGGGCYTRQESELVSAAHYMVSARSEKSNLYRSIKEAILRWKSEGDIRAVIEIADSEIYHEDIVVALAEGSVLEIRASQEERPILGSIKVQGAKKSRLVLDGLWIDSHASHSTLTVEPGAIESIAIRHCTIVPTRELENENFAISSGSEAICDWNNIGQQAEATKLREFLAHKLGLGWVPEGAEFEKHTDTEIEYITYKTGNQELRIETKNNSTLASLKTTSGGGVWKKVYEFSILNQHRKRILYAYLGRNENLEIEIEKSVCGAINVPDAQLSVTDSIIDGVHKEALSVRTAVVKQSTILGSTMVEELALASNSIFTGIVNAKMDQKGCARFSYIPSDSKAPRRYKCQPSESTPEVEPRFTSEQYGNPGYAQLHRSVDAEIFEGADNGAEMGAFNHLLQAHRISDLKSALDDYLRFGLEVGVFLVS